MSRRGFVGQRGRKQDEKALRGVSWYYVVDVTPAGAPKRQQRSKGGFRTKEDAETAMRAVIASLDDGSYVPPSELTLGAYLDQWLDGLASRRKATTVDGYRRVVAAYVKPSLSDVELQHLTALDLDALYARLLERGKRDGSPLSARTVRYVHAVIGRALGDARRKGLVRVNVAKDADPPSASAARAPEQRAWTADQLGTFLASIDGHHHGPMFRLAAMSGLRRGELCGLRWEDVDLDAGTVTVRQTITTIGHRIVFGTPKTKRSRRVVAIDPQTVAVLRRHRLTQREQRIAVGPGYRDHGLVFAALDGQPWNPDTIGQAFDRAVARTELPRIRLHDLRHTHASLLLAAGVNVKVVSERLGHASTAFTLDVYGHRMPGQDQDAADAVGRLVDGLS